jgi:hypothetical protein
VAGLVVGGLTSPSPKDTAPRPTWRWVSLNHDDVGPHLAKPAQGVDGALDRRLSADGRDPGAPAKSGHGAGEAGRLDQGLVDGGFGGEQALSHLLRRFATLFQHVSPPRAAPRLR